MLGLFDRPADEKAFEALLEPPVILGLTESLTDLSTNDWRRILAKLRRARLLAGEDPYNPGDLDTHPLFVNILANSSGLKGSRLGRNAISGFTTIIKRLRLSCRIASERWSHFS